VTKNIIKNRPDMLDEAPANSLWNIISPLDRRRFLAKTYVDSLTAVKYSAHAIENCYPLYDEVFQKGSLREGPEPIN
jgi:hypothetical protein